MIWLAVPALALGSAAVGLWVHHRRFLGYHAHKRLSHSVTFGRWLSAEARDFTVLGWWHVRGFLRDDLRVPSEPRGRPVLCVHGWTQNATNFWGLRRALERMGRPTVAISLFHRFAPLRWYARRLERRLELLAARFPDGVDVVAHSMGGVVLRMVLASREDLRGAVRTVVTLGTPHRGTAAARGIPLVPELVAMKRRSALWRDLPELPALVPHGRVVVVAGDADTLVYPVETSLVAGAEAVVLRGVGHAGLLTRPRAWAAVRRALRG